MSKQVRRNPLPGKVGSMHGCTPDCTTNYMGCTEPREPSTPRTDEDRFTLVIAEAAFFAEALQYAREIGCKGNPTFFSDFSAQRHVRRPLEPQVSGVTPIASDTRAPVRARKSRSA